MTSNPYTKKQDESGSVAEQESHVEKVLSAALPARSLPACPGRGERPKFFNQPDIKQA